MEFEHMTPEGVSIFHDANHQLHSFCLCLYVKAGSMYENQKNNGISHFFEHIVFRNIHQVMEGGLYQTLDRLGLEFNATTYKEFIQFIITGAPQHFMEAARILTGIFEPLVLSEEEVDIERKRIKAEIREEDEENSLSYFTKQIVWKGTPLAYTITGRKKCLNDIGKKRLLEFQQEVLAVNNIFFYVTGNYPQNAIVALSDMISRYHLKKEIPFRNNEAPVPKDFFHRKGKARIKNAKKTCVCIGVDMDAEKYSTAELNLLFDILFEGDFCKVHQALSERKGYVYSYDPSFEQYKNLAHMQLLYEVSPKYLYDSVKTVFEIFQSLKKGVQDELDYVKPYYVDNAGFILDNAEDYNWVRAYEGHILDIPYKNLEDRIEVFRNITPERMTKICREVFCIENLTLTLEGKKKKIDKKYLHELLSGF